MGPRLNHWIRGEKRVRVSDWPESCALARMGVVVPRCWVDTVTLADRADYVRLGIAVLGITGLPNLHIILSAPQFNSIKIKTTPCSIRP